METAAICAYLADAFPQAGLAPEPDVDGATRAENMLLKNRMRMSI